MRQIPIKIFVTNILLIAIAAYFLFPYSNHFIWPWDDGNNFYPAFAFQKNQLPNIDYVNGYPGFMTWILSFFPDVVKAKTAGLSIGGLAAIIAFWIGDRLEGTWAGILSFLFVLEFGIIRWHSPNAGWAMLLLSSAALLCLSSAITGLQQKSAFMFWMIFGSFFVGLSCSFKQSGIFPVFAWIQCLAVIVDTTRLRKILLLVLVAFLPFAAFLILRVARTFLDVPMNSIIIIPWALSLALSFQMGRSNSVRVISSSFFASSIFVTGLGMLAWTSLYGTMKSAALAFQEMYVRIPRLIDRHQIRIEIPRFNEILSRMVRGLANLDSSDQYFLVVLGSFILSIFIWKKLSLHNKILILFSFTTLASGFPYSGNLMYDSVFIILIYIVLKIGRASCRERV